MRGLTSIIFKNAKRNDSNGRKFLLDLAFFIVFAVLSGTMAIFSYIITKELMEIEQSYLFINILLLINFILLFAKSIFECLNVLYFSKDLKILLRMPIKSKDIVHAKFLNMIVSEYHMESIMLGIPMIVFGLLTNANVIFYLYMIAVLIILPVIPIVITSVILAIIMRFTNKIKNKSKAMYATIILCSILIGFLGVEFSNIIGSDMGFKALILETNGVAESIAEKFVLIKPIMNTLLNYDNINGIKNLFIYVIETVGCYIVSLLFISRIYLDGAIGTTINGETSRDRKNKELKMSDFKQYGVEKAYILKELKMTARVAIFNIQCLITPVVSTVVTLMIVISFIKFCQRFDWDVIGHLTQLLNSTIGKILILSVGQLFYMLNFNSIISISKDGRSYKIMKYIPIDMKKQIKMKMLMGELINLIPTIALSWFYYRVTNATWTTFLIFMSLLILNVVGEKFKLYLDINNPNINWDSEYTMMKNNTNVMFVLFYTLIVILALALIGGIVRNSALFEVIVLVVLILIDMYLTIKSSKILNEKTCTVR